MKTSKSARQWVKALRVVLCVAAATAALAEFHAICTWGKSHSQQTPSQDQPILPASYQGFDLLLTAR